jgi:hypothetical protein
VRGFEERRERGVLLIEESAKGQSRQPGSNHRPKKLLLLHLYSENVLRWLHRMHTGVRGTCFRKSWVTVN